MATIKELQLAAIDAQLAFMQASFNLEYARLLERRDKVAADAVITA